MATTCSAPSSPGPPRDAAIQSGSTARSAARLIQPTAASRSVTACSTRLVAFNRKPFAGERHLARLAAHAEAIGIALDLAAVRAGWAAVIGAARSEHVILRTTVTRGVTTRGLWPKAPVGAPTIVVSATPWSSGLVGRAGRIDRQRDCPQCRLSRFTAEGAGLPRQHPCGARGCATRRRRRSSPER